MANEKTVVEEIECRDLEDDSKLKVTVLACTELGNNSKPGLQVMWMGNIVNFHPLAAEKWAYDAKKILTCSVGWPVKPKNCFRRH